MSQSETDELLPAAGAAELLGLPVSSLFFLVRTGALPRPLKLGRRSRWSRRGLLEWVEKQHAAAQSAAARPGRPRRLARRGK